MRSAHTLKQLSKLHRNTPRTFYKQSSSRRMSISTNTCRCLKKQHMRLASVMTFNLPCLRPHLPPMKALLPNPLLDTTTNPTQLHWTNSRLPRVAEPLTTALRRHRMKMQAVYRRTVCWLPAHRAHRARRAATTATLWFTTKIQKTNLGLEKASQTHPL